MTTARRKPYPYSMAHQPGFTLVELIAVIVVVGILGAVAVSRFMGGSSFDSVAYANQTAALMRYAQKVAVAQNRDVFVRLQANGIALCYDADCTAGKRVAAPGGGNSDSAATKAACKDSSWACEAPPEQVRITPVVTFLFDPLGVPVAVPTGPGAAVTPFSKLQVTVRASDSVRNITVEMETGYVH